MIKVVVGDGSAHLKKAKRRGGVERSDEVTIPNYFKEGVLSITFDCRCQSLHLDTFEIGSVRRIMRKRVGLNFLD
jgi:hypothetical protein